MESTDCNFCGNDREVCRDDKYDDVKVNYRTTPEEFRLMMVKVAIKKIQREIRPNFGLVTDEKINWLKKCLNAPDVLLFIKLV